MQESTPTQKTSLLAMDKVLSAGGEVGALMRAIDWSKTPLGPMEAWPQSLRTAVSICLHSRFELFIWWGPELVMIYNDAYQQTLQSKHPWALGKPGRVVWAEIWPVIGPMLDHVMASGDATWSDDLLLFLERHGYPEETYHTFSYSPIIDESGHVGGVFTAVTQTTEKVIGERRLRTLRDVAARSADAKGETEAWNIIADVLRDNPFDVQFAVLYRLQADGKSATAAAYAGVEEKHRFFPPLISTGTLASQQGCSPWVLDAISCGRAVEVRDAHEFGYQLPGGAWNEEPNELVFIPLIQTGQAQPLGVLVAGVSRRKRLDEDYRGFFNILAGQISKSIADAQAFEKERKRAEALSEIDRAKTAFFSNVSHEFRTPLTLMLGPLEDTLAADAQQLGQTNLERLQTVHRNGMRLLKLVNMLLDFSRIEAGRVQASYEAVDLSTYTAELASVFRSAIERAGLYLKIDCEPLQDTVYVDRDMWEKIVLNLLSNSFKFTFSGGISVAVKERNGRVHLTVSDTGTGIPKHELPRLFERFHRVEGAKGRSFEGSGIGLALIQELVKLHGGTVSAESELGKGTTFTVSFPTGNAHLPADRINANRSAGTGLRAEAYVDEAERWLTTSSTQVVADTATATSLPTVVLADDNADMRDYVANLLSTKYHVLVADNGDVALELVKRHHPDLVLTDVMMPVLDGFGLLREIRALPAAAPTPVVMLSARAGEEARVEGMQAGADDYLVKPFTARELLARVNAHLSISRTRRDAAEKERRLLAEAEADRTKLRELTDQLRMLNDVGQRIAAELDQDKLLQLITDVGTQGTGAQFGAFFYNVEDEHGESYMLYTLSGVDRSHFSKFPMPRNTAVFAPTFEGGPPVRSDNIRKDPRYGHNAPHYGIPAGHLPVVSYLATSVRGKEGHVIGGLFFGHSAEGVFTERDEKFVEALGSQAGFALENARLYRAAQDELDRRRKVESELEEQRRFLALAQKSANVGSWQLDLTTDPVTAIWSEELEVLYGYKPGSFGGLYEHWIAALHPDDRESAPRSVREAINNQTPWVKEFRILRQDGEVRWMSGRGQCYYDHSGNPVRMIGVNMDITEKRISEEALRNSEKLAATGRLAATIAHEINNPLEAITNLIYLARCNDEVPSDAKMHLELADRELERVSHIAQQTLGFYRDTSSPVVVNIRDAFRDVLRLFERKLEYKSLALNIDIPEEVQVKALRGEMRQVFSNLIANAVDASRKNGSITVRVRQIKRKRENLVSVAVADNGQGIPKAMRHSIFTPFFTTKKDVGTGLGLWVTRSMIEKHGGSIRFRSIEGSGAVFRIVLPTNLPRDNHEQDAA